MEGPARGSRSGFLGFLSTLVLPLRIGGATHEAKAFGKLFHVLVHLAAAQFHSLGEFGLG